MSVSFKMFLVGFLVLLCYIPSLMVYGLVAERQGRQYEAINEISSKWGAAQTVSGPMMNLPNVIRARDEKGVVFDQTVNAAVAPKSVQVEVKVDTEIRYRGIFRVPVYTAEIAVSGVLSAAKADGRVLQNQITLDAGVSDLHGLVEQPKLLYGGKEITFVPGSTTYGATGMQALLPSPPAEDTPFRYTLKLRGTESLDFLPSGQTMTVRMTSPWIAPSFVGGVLPTTYEITPAGFTSEWNVSPWWANGGAIAQPSTYTDQYGYEYQNANTGVTFGVKLLETTDFYTLVDRAIKYAILFIGLTFLVLFLVEVLHTERVHPFQYILVGAALCLFYLLLLSLSEHIGFLPAYLLSAAATVALVSWYSMSVLRHKKFGTSVGVLLAVLYAYLYALLQVEDYALLLGSVILFIILAAVMYVTRKVDWYGKDPD